MWLRNCRRLVFGTVCAVASGGGCETDKTVLGLNAPDESGAADAAWPSLGSTLDAGVDASANVDAVDANGPAAEAEMDAASDPDGGEDPDTSAAPCAPCAVGQSCALDTDCQNAVGATCSNGVCTLSQTCGQIQSVNLAAADGIYTVDVDGPTGTLAPFSVYCDMTTAGGGWTRVGYEPAHTGGDHIQGNLPYLGIEVGSSDDVANASAAALIGDRFNGTYRELAVTWGSDYARMTVTQDIFVNDVEAAIPVGDFVTSDASLSGWVSAAGGAIFCRAARSPDVRPGDTSWALKPSNSTGTDCGCDDPTWHDEGAFYGGLLQATSCSSWGGAWAGVKADGQNKAGLPSMTDLSLWIR